MLIKKENAYSQNNPIRIMIVDDHPIIHTGLEKILDTEDDMKICGNAKSANEAIHDIGEIKPDIVIIDITLKGGISGIELINGIKNRYPEINTLVLSMHDEEIYAERAIRAGAKGYIMKEELNNTIADAIRKIMNGKIYLSENIVSQFLNDMMFKQSNKINAPIDQLTNRELEVLQLISQGLKTNEIAKRLNVSVRTIGTHKFRIKNKLNFKNSAELVKYAVEWTNKL